MKISYNWLKQYLNIDLPAERVSEILTDTGLEVEGLEKVDTIKGGLRGVLIGEVLETRPHPNADRLKVCTVNIGADEPVQIVCGAKNVAANQKVPVATVGTEIFLKDDSFTIKKSKLRGEVSEGMICAEDELGLGDDHDGIMVLDPSAEVGSPAAEYFNIESDYLIEIGLTPNRTDAMSHYGVARDLRAALLRFGEENLDLHLPSTANFLVKSKELPIDVEIESTDSCYRYMGVSIKGVEIGPSPDWMQNRLRTIGLNPINLAVDVTNFVLHECGHPMHAFDADKIADHKIIVRKAKEGEAFTTLDETELKLSDQDMVIADTEKALVLAGVYGGLNSGVSHETKNIFLEAAYFNPVSIRKSAKRHGLNTDSSFRYERGVDPEMTEYALRRAASLILEYGGGEIAMEPRDEHPVKLEPFQVSLDLDYMDTLIGESIPMEMVRTILAGLEIRIKAETSRTLQLEVPQYRQDVQRPADIVEEVLRIYGFNAVPYEGAMQLSVAKIDPRDDSKQREVISSLLSASEFNEMMNNSLTKASHYEKYGYQAEASVKMLNPLSQDLGVMRQSLLFGGLEVIDYNRKRQRLDLKVYEFGRTYQMAADGSYKESERLGIWISGQERRENWKYASQDSDFFNLKNAVLNVLDRLGIQGYQESYFKDAIYGEGLRFNRGQSSLVDMGSVHPKVLKDFDIKAPVYYADLNWDMIRKAAKKVQIVMEDLPKYPEVRRDLALLVNKEVNYSDLAQTASKAGGKLLRSINLFDVYEGKNLPEGKKSYALSFVFRHDEKTLNDKAVEQFMSKILKSLEESHEASLR